MGSYMSKRGKGKKCNAREGKGGTEVLKGGIRKRTVRMGKVEGK